VRRPRTSTDWWFYGLAACIALMTAAIVLCAVERHSLVRETGMLREQINVMQHEPATGGAEVPIPQVLSGSGWRFPIAESDYLVLTSPFGVRVSPLLHVEMYHQGLDIAGAWRSQVVAVADGVVVEHWPPPDGYYRGHSIYGGMVRLEHDDGKQTLYAHLSWSRVHTGDTVRAGQVIGRVGVTGKCTGAHLHFEVIAPDGERLNPLLYIEEPAQLRKVR